MYNVICTMVHQLIINMEALYKYMYHCTPTSYKYESTVHTVLQVPWYINSSKQEVLYNGIYTIVHKLLNNKHISAVQCYM